MTRRVGPELAQVVIATPLWRWNRHLSSATGWL